MTRLKLGGSVPDIRSNLLKKKLIPAMLLCWFRILLMKLVLESQILTPNK
jgi:hypothetical protein